MNILTDEKDNFFNLVDSLKKCRRADLSDIGDDNNIIEKLYIDPLENDLVLKSTLKNNTTVLTGRRGTGKSTIIARLQHEVRKSSDKLSLYIDVKSIFEQSKSFSYNHTDYPSHLDPEDLKKYLIYKAFLREIISEIKKEVKTNTLKFYMAKIIRYFGPDKEAYERELNGIFENIDQFEFHDVEVFKNKKLSTTNSSDEKRTKDLSIEGKFSATNAGVALKAEQNYESTNKTVLTEDFYEALLKSFNPILIMRSIKGLLEKISIKTAFICLDDFSEIELDAMKVFVDVIIAPLNNLSDEFFKFKIAAYPGRIYLGDIDPQKIEQIKLDFYDLYQSKTITETQNQAKNNIKNLIEKRISYFCQNEPDYFFDTSKSDIDDFYKLIFDITSSVPRNVGWILWYANQQSISKDRKINMTDLLVAAEKHYKDTILPYFSKNLFMREPFEMKLEKFHLHELINTFVKSAKDNKREISLSDSKIFEKDKSKPPTSHFYISKKLEDILQPLELQFFISKYNEQKDQDSNELMSFFSLNYGLCVSEDLHYGRGSDRKYVIQRRFNNTKLVQNYLNSAKNIICQNNECGSIYEYEKLPNLEMFDMLCPKCKKGICVVKHANADIQQAPQELQLPEFEILLLNSLNIDSPQYASALAQELDCTYQKIGKRAVRLSDDGYVKIEEMTKDKKIGKRKYYSISNKAIDTFFATGNQ